MKYIQLDDICNLKIIIIIIIISQKFVLKSLCVLNVKQPRSTNKLTAVIDNISIYMHGHYICAIPSDSKYK